MGAEIGPERIDAMQLRALARFSSLRQDAFRCVCQDSGFIDEEGSNPPCVIPCSRCNQSTYDRWIRGGFRASDQGGNRREQTPDAAERRAERERFGSRR